MTAKQSPSDVQILVVDDEPDLRTLYELALVREGYAVVGVGNLADARQLLGQQRFDVVITDMRLPDGLGTSLLLQIREQRRSERCVVITAYGSAENAVESLKTGAFDYLTKPVDIRQFRSVVASAVQGARAEAVPGRRHSAPGAGEAALRRLVGGSAAMRAVKERVAKVARSMAPVLVTGESGTGKELVARALHANSHRHAGPFVPVNCSAIPDNLLESEFFGVRKGAFTGAAQDRDGFFQAARGGSLFLDEIGDLPLAMQSKLLRAVQERCVRAVGSVQEEPVDVRIISATHRDLGADVLSGRFRQDLFYRLAVFLIRVPPLRDCRQDIPVLVEHFSRSASQRAGRAVTFSSGAIARLRQLDWPGNVRELENVVERLVASARTPVVEASDIGVDAVAGTPAGAHPFSDMPTLDELERRYLVYALQRFAGNRTRTAAALGIDRRTLYRMSARLGVPITGADLQGANTAGN